MTRHPNARAVNRQRPIVHTKMTNRDVRKLEAQKGFDIKTRTVGNDTVHYDARDKRPHTIHKYHYTHKGEKKTGFFKSLYKSAREIYQHHLENKEKRARIREEQAIAAVDESRAKAEVIRAKGEAKKNQELGYAEVQRAKGEKYERIGEGVRKAESGFGEAARETGEGIRRAEKGIGEGIGEANRGEEEKKHWWN